MKQILFLVAILFLQEMKATAFTVTDVKIAITADSAGEARAQALDKSYFLAFEKLLEENFPDSLSSTPPEEILKDLVVNFSIDKEKTTPQTYTASLTFHFDPAGVESWLFKNKSPSEPVSSSFQNSTKSLNFIATYSTFEDWQTLKKGLTTSPGMEEIKILTLAPSKATLEIVYGGLLSSLQHHLQQKGITLSVHDKMGDISLTSPSSYPPNTY